MADAIETLKPYAFLSERLKKILKKLKKKDRQALNQIEEQIEKILQNPEVGKPLRYDMKHLRRVHVGSFVLVYKIIGNEIRFLDFDHHDKVYNKQY